MTNQRYKIGDIVKRYGDERLIYLYNMAIGVYYFYFLDDPNEIIQLRISWADINTEKVNASEYI